MTSIIPISNTPATMSSREIAELTDKQHAHVCRDIRTMLEQIHGVKDDPNLDHKEIQGVTEERDERGYVSIYHLDRNHTLTLIAGYRADLRFRIVQRWQELEAQTALPIAKPAPSVDAILLKHRQAKAIASTYMYAAKLLGTDAPMARAVAVDAVKKQTGVDFLPLLAGNTIEEKPVTPTELGKLRGWSAKETNAQLALAGLQIKNGDGEWVPTDIGRIYCTCNPYKAPHSQHTGYRTLWYRTVLDVLDNRQQEAA